VVLTQVHELVIADAALSMAADNVVLIIPEDNPTAAGLSDAVQTVTVLSDMPIILATLKDSKI